MIGEIQDNYSDLSTITQEKGFISYRSGNLVPKKTTRGWQILVEFKDISSNWVNLNDPNLSNPVELAEYSLLNGLTENPALKWWVKEVLQKRDCIIEKLNNKYLYMSYKFGIKITKIVQDVYDIYKETKKYYCRETIGK